MTIENELYGGGWQRCSNCGVKDRPDQLVGNATTGWLHIVAKTAVCAEWKALLARAKPADIQQAAFQLCERTQASADELLDEVHHPGPGPTVTTLAYPRPLLATRKGTK